MPKTAKAVFLSYASQDVAAALRLGEALRAAGVEVWLDQSELVGGDVWDAKIRKQIAECALFVPIVSANTQARLEGYFRIEWKLAAQRTHAMAEEKAFLLPVVIDGTRDAEAKVPVEFRAVQWTRLAPSPGLRSTGRPAGFDGPAPDDPALEAFCARVKSLLGGSEMEAGRPRPAQRDEGVSSPPSQPVLSRKTQRRVPAAAWLGAMGFIALAALAVWQPWKSKAPATASSSATPSLADASAVGVTKADKSIAVLPFENMSDDKDNTAFFSDGMHEDILTNLANIRDLRVISRTSVMNYRGTKKKIPEIARELGVTYILEGSVRRAGSTVRITGQLIRAANDEHLWAKSYDRELTPKEVFSIQAALATEIAGALQAAISPETKKLLERRPTENLAAYDLYLKARPMFRGKVQEQNKREPLLRAAVGLDPKFAAAWAELAVNHGYVFRDQERTPARLAQADAALARAVRLAPDASETIMARGYLAYLGHRDWTRATADFEKIVRLQPNNAEAFLGLATVQKRQGLWLASLANLRKALQLDPGSWVIEFVLVQVLSAGRRWDEMRVELQRLFALLPEEEKSSHSLPGWLAPSTFSATGSTQAVDDWLAGLTPAQRESSPRSLRKWRANVRGDYAEWQRLDQPSATSTDADGVRQSEETTDAIEAAFIIAAHGDRVGARLRLGSDPAQLRSRLERDPANERLWSQQALMEALLGQAAEARRDARKAVELMPESLDTHDGPRYSRTLAVVHAWTGDKDRALAELTRLLRVPFGYKGSVHDLRVDAKFAPLRGDPRFEALLKDPKNIAPLF